MNRLLQGIFIFMLALAPILVKAQACDPSTPVYYVDLSGQPNGTYISPADVRDGLCCGATSPDKCIAFVITLDSLANGIIFDIASGAVPPGALFYQVACGPPVAVGSILCLNGPGPHYLTFCKPGNNQNTYSITSLPQPSTYGTQTVSQACSGQFGVSGLEPSTIVWSTIPNNPVYNSYLSCTGGCPDVTLTPPSTGLPPTITYQVCGYVIGGCFPFYFCDTFVVNMVNVLDVNITPQNQTICYGGPDIPITANVSGGIGPYQYLWSTGETTPTIIVGPGVYTVQLIDSLNCSVAYNTVTINGIPSAIIANAGPDQILCTSQPITNLNGSVQTATGGIWSGGNGTFIPGNTNLNATYIPSAAEINAGFAQLILTTTGNLGCPAVTDTVIINISPDPAPSISGPASMCVYTTQSYTTPYTPGNTYFWTVTGGTIINTLQNNITVLWGAAGNGTVNVLEVNTSGCDSAVTIPVTINPEPAPVINGPGIVCTLSGSTFTVASPQPGSTYQWNVSGGTVTGSTTTSSVQVNWNIAGSATITLTEINSFGCDSTVSIPVSILTQPQPSIAGVVNGCAGQSMTYTTPLVTGNSYTWSVTGGTITANNNNSVTIFWPTATNGTLTLTESNSLSCDSTVSLNVVVGPQPAPAINGTQTICSGTTFTYSVANPVPGDLYQWSVTGGVIMNASNGASVNIFWQQPGQATVTVQQLNSYGCDSIVSIPVQILIQPTPAITGAGLVCAGQTVTYSTPLVTGNTYNWNVTGGILVSNNNNSITVTWPTATSGSVTLTEANTLTCDSTVSFNVAVGAQPAPGISGTQTICTGNITTFYVTNPVAGDFYQWSITGGTLMTASNGTSIQVYFSQPGQANVSVYQINGYGCDSLVSIPVQVLTQPAPMITGAGLVCAGQTVTYSTPLVTGNTYNWNVTGGIVTSNNNNSITVLWPSATSGSVTLTEANSLACDSTVAFNVAVGAQPAPVISGTQTMCTGNITTFYVTNPIAGDNYQWSVTGGTMMTANNGTSIQVYFSQPGQATVSVYQINGLGCNSLVSIPVQVLTQPAPAISGNTSGCAGQSFTYSTPLVPGNTYNWNITGGIITSMNQNTVTVLWPTGTSGTLSVTEANTLACDSTVSIQVNIGPQPAPSILGNPTVCAGNIEAYSLSVPVPGDLYQWSVTGGVLMSSPNSSSVQVAWTTAGTGTVSVNQSNGFGCDSTVSFGVTVLTMPNPTISGNATACAGQSITYATPFVSGHTYQWSVTGGTITATNNNTITVFWPIAANGSVTLNESNTLACDSSLTLYVVVGDQPAPSLSGPVVVCTNDHMQYTLTNFTAGNNFVWTVNGGIIIGPANGSSITVVWTIPGQQTISVTESNVFGCNATVDITVQVRLKPAPTLTGPTSGCEATRLVYAVQNLPGHSYFWTVTGGSVIGTVVNHTIEVLWTTPGPGSVSVNVVSPLGCDSLVSMPVIIYASPNPALMGPPMVCSGEHVTLFTNAQPGNIYTWNATNATFAGSTSGNTVTVIPSAQGVTSVTVTETTVHGCENQATFYIMVNETPSPVISGSNVGCISGQQYNYSTPSQPYVAYQWSVTGGNVTAGMGTNAITVEWTNPGTQTISLTATNILSGCDSTIQFNVLTGSLPPPVINAPSLSGCAPLSAAFTGNTAHPDYTYSWDFGDGTTGYGSNPTHNYFNPGTYNVVLSATNNTGCASTATATINVYPSPVSSFQMTYGGDIYYTSTSILTLNNYSQGAVSYLWDFGNGDTSTVFEPQYGYNNTGSYTVTLTATNQYGCTSVSMSSLQVKSPEHLYVPNAFSPNGDGTNDFFDVGNWNIINLRVNIYNRWGDMIYTSGNPDFRWDGTHHGKPVQEGVYVYQIAAIGIHGEEFDLIGTVTVVR